MNSTIKDLLFFSAGAIVTQLINIFFVDIRKIYYSEEHQKCIYITPKMGTRTEHNIIIKKRFNKTIDINCPHFKKRKQEEVEGIKYLHCAFGGKNLTPSGRSYNKCTFSKN